MLKILHKFQINRQTERECGFLQVKQQGSNQNMKFSNDWETYWCVFEEGILSFAISKDCEPNPALNVSMDGVVSLRADENKEDG